VGLDELVLPFPFHAIRKPALDVIKPYRDRISGTITDHEKKIPIAGAEVHAGLQNSREMQTCSLATTDRNGEYKVDLE